MLNTFHAVLSFTSDERCFFSVLIKANFRVNKMGKKKGKKDKKISGIEKTALKTEKKAEKRAKKQLREKGEVSIDYT